MDEETIRVYRTRALFDNASEFRERFLLTPNLFYALLERVGPDLCPNTRRSCSITPEQKLMIALRFYTTNPKYYNAGDAQGLGNFVLIYNFILYILILRTRQSNSMSRDPSSHVDFECAFTRNNRLAHR